MQSTKDELFALLNERSVQFGDFTLKSGIRTNFYLDCRKTSFHPRGAHLIGKILYPMIRNKEEEIGVQISAVGGMTMGADPVSLAIAMRSELRGDEPPLTAFSVRKGAKEHGAKNLIEGCFEPGSTVVAVDDVITTGGSTLDAIEKMEDQGAKVAFVVCVVERQEGGRKALEAKGYPVLPIFTKGQFISQ